MIENLWLDDIRRPPDPSWVWARTIEMAKQAVMLSEPFVVMSLDHDMGLDGYDPDEPGADERRVPRRYTHNVCENVAFEERLNTPKEWCPTCQEPTDEDEWTIVAEPDGMEFARWLVSEEADKIPPTIYIHSMNNVCAMRMAHVLEDHTHVIVKPYQRWYKE